MRSFIAIIKFVMLVILGFSFAYPRIVQAEDNLPILPMMTSIPQMGCVNGSVPVPPGRILTWQPPGCTAADGLIEIRNYTYGCVVPEISGVSRPKVVEAYGLDLIVLGFYQPDSRFLSCIPAARKKENGEVAYTTVWVFLPSSQVTLGGSGYRVPRNWHITDVTIDAASGVPVKALNGNIGGLTKPAEYMFTCRPTDYNANSQQNDWNDGVPVYKYKYINCPY